MGRKAKELGALAVKNLKTPGLHFVGGVDGLALQIAPGGSRSWVLRAMMGGKRREMGLGGYPDMTLARAQDAARDARAKIKAGIDPINDARNAKSQLEASRATDVTFEVGARQYIETHEKSWSTKSHYQWLSSLETHVFPKIGSLYMRDVDVPQVLAVLKPIWYDKTETAGRVRGRIEKILSWAKAGKLRTGENPARWTGHLDAILPARKKIQKVEHFKALPYTAVGQFMADLRAQEGQGARALEFAILTAARSTQARGATWSEIDLNHEDGPLWMIPAERMKTKEPHKVPLSPTVVKLLQDQPRFEGTDLVFPSAKLTMISDATMGAVLKRMKVEAVPHGFRSTFKTWASEITNYARDVVEMALAHAISSKVEEAYQRGDLFQKRVHLMEDWAKFCSAPYIARKRPVVVALPPKAA